MKCSRCGSKGGLTGLLVCPACGSHWCKKCVKKSGNWGLLWAKCPNYGEKLVIKK